MKGSFQELQTNVFVQKVPFLLQGVSQKVNATTYIYSKRSPLKVVNSYKFSYLKTAVVLLTQFTQIDDPADENQYLSVIPSTKKGLQKAQIKEV